MVYIWKCGKERNGKRDITLNLLSHTGHACPFQYSSHSKCVLYMCKRLSLSKHTHTHPNTKHKHDARLKVLFFLLVSCCYYWICMPLKTFGGVVWSGIETVSMRVRFNIFLLPPGLPIPTVCRLGNFSFRLSSAILWFASASVWHFGLLCTPIL